MTGLIANAAIATATTLGQTTATPTATTATTTDTATALTTMTTLMMMMKQQRRRRPRSNAEPKAQAQKNANAVLLPAWPISLRVHLYIFMYREFLTKVNIAWGVSTRYQERSITNYTNAHTVARGEPFFGEKVETNSVGRHSLTHEKNEIEKNSCKSIYIYIYIRRIHDG